MRAGTSMPLWRLLGGRSGKIKAYASGINPGGARQTAEAALKRGHRALKLKVGFDPDDRSRQSGGAAHCRRRRHAGGGRQSGLVDRSGAADRAAARRVRSALAGRAASRRSAAAGMAEAARKRRHAACGRREHREPRRFRAGPCRGRARCRSARHRQMGRADASAPGSRATS